MVVCCPELERVCPVIVRGSTAPPARRPRDRSIFRLFRRSAVPLAQLWGFERRPACFALRNHPTTCRSILAFLAPRRSAQTRQHASPCAIAPPLAARSHSRGTLAAQIPIAEPAARPTERTSRDFVPWRFSDAGHQSAWLDRRCRRPKTCTKPDYCTAANSVPNGWSWARPQFSAAGS